jgi:hypothetical protein
MTSRGWSSTGKELFSLQRLAWTGRTPFEMKTVRATPDGFEIEYTLPVNREQAADPAAYQVIGFNYKYQSSYGSPVINKGGCPVRGVVVSEDGLKARLVVDSLRLGYIPRNHRDRRTQHGRQGPAAPHGLLHPQQHSRRGKAQHCRLGAQAQPFGNDGSFQAGGRQDGCQTAAALAAKRVTEMPASWGPARLHHRDGHQAGA